MKPEPDQAFFDRADAHIHLSNAQMKEAEVSVVSASMMYANARFSTWLNATLCRDAAEMAEHRDEAIHYFVNQFHMMLEDHFDDYQANFDRYMKPTP
ncbi:hypothetical protein ABI_13990 [Asticcacaulis biprosthecium C19]|uniref:DUF3144 domain-containing protein n=1 Tax=Asticcacaulis biprosthecium C19 TaxID=715226 RepID=F4QIH1_9CAUL|nr:DUF3144 domain-containing protein [Asticcacaulis biprosthecium]EGF92960.1 hypothetical protein ABI_13990 [Asticcacaulis biprosthecium C19]